MLTSKSFLAVDFGAGSLKVAEFEVNESGGLRLKYYGTRSLGPEGAQETSREATILKALQELISEKGFKARDVNVCAPGFHVFSKFVKLPPVDAGKVTQIIQYEAQQNVPFPLSEVVWDYQILGSAPGGELEVLLVAIKAEIVEGLFRVADAAKLKLQVADVSPAALCNAFRYNYGDLEDCTMLLDIGAKTSNLLFFEKGKVFSRSINLGANSITQDFANEAKLKFGDAEKIKIEEGFVSLGGAYEEPENPHQAAISKIARQFMTRLHIQVNQTMQFYRGQQGGSAPQRLFLSGGASIMPYTAQFFAEKLNVPVEYFNPFRNVQIDPAVNLEDLARVAHSMGEVVGLGLRNLAHCPVELNLMPESTRKWRSFNEKKPYLIATVSGIVAIVAVTGLLFQRLAGLKKDELVRKVQQPLADAESRQQRFDRIFGEFQSATNDLGRLTTYMEQRYFWGDVMSELRRVLVAAEEKTQQKLGKAEPGVWIEQFITAPPRMAFGGDGMPIPAPGHFGGNMGGAENAGMPPPTDPSGMPMPPMDGAGGGITNITLICRAVDLTSVVPEANTTLMYNLESELQASTNLFDAKETRLVNTGGGDPSDPTTSTFTFRVVVSLKQPLKL